MKKILLVAVIQLFTILSVFSQTVSEPSIYKQIPYGTQKFSIEYLKVGDAAEYVYWGYQDPEYKAITKFVSFILPDIDTSIRLVDKIIFILGMEPTSTDGKITDEWKEVSAGSTTGLLLNRFGFNQKKVYIINQTESGLVGGLQIDLVAANELKMAFAIQKEKGKK